METESLLYKVGSEEWLKMKLAKRVQQIAPSSTLAITAKAKALKDDGHDVIGLGAGEPDFNTPEHIIEAAIKAMQDGKTKYTPAGGILELRQAIVEKLKTDQQLNYQANQIIVCSGAKHALYNIFQAILDPGDEVLIPTPYWVSYPEQVKLADGLPVYIEGLEENGYKIKPDQISSAVTTKTKAIIINSPSNPTGAVYNREELEALAEVCLKHNLYIISDEIYEKLIYDQKEHISIASLGSEVFEKTFVVNGVSKPYSMTGWRIGYAAGPTDVIKGMTDLSSHSTSNPTSIAQYAALAAITGTQEPLLRMHKAFDERRQKVLAELKKIQGLQCLEPAGAFYLFPNVKEIVAQSRYADVDAWAAALLEEEKVAVVPGSGFGAPDNIRLSYAAALDHILEGVRRIETFVNKTR